MTPTRTAQAPRKRGRAEGELLHEQAYVQLKQGLLSGDLLAGSFLSERQIAAELGMSKTPVKTAIARLEQEGFLKVSPQQGVIVCHLGIEEIADHVELRIALESYGVRQIAQSGISNAQWRSLEEHLLKQERCAQAEDIMASVQLDGEFHLLLCQFLGNRELLRIMSQVQDKMFRIMGNILHRHPHRIAETQREHGTIAAAVREGRGQLAAELMVQHIERGKQFLTAP